MMALLFWLCIVFVFYVYFGFPAILALLARLHPKPAAMPATPPYTPTVTLLIAAYNEQDVLARKIENSLALDYPRECLQILIVADGSDDRSAEIVQIFGGQGVELLYQPDRRGKMAAINRAMPHARGEIIAFSDANNLYSPDYLRLITAPFANPAVGAATGAKTVAQGDGSLGESEGMYWKYESFIKKQESRLGSCTSTSGEVLAIRRSLYQSPPPSVINDDFMIAMLVIRQGYRMVYVPQARSYERVSASAEDEIARRSRIIAGRYQAMILAGHYLTWRRPLILWQVVSHKFMRMLVPFAMLGALLANLGAVAWPAGSSNIPWLWLAPPFHWIYLGAQIIFYGLAWIGSRASIPGKIGKLLYLPTFLVNSNLAAVIGLVRFLTRQQTVLWQRVARRD